MKTVDEGRETRGKQGKQIIIRRKGDKEGMRKVAGVGVCRLTGRLTEWTGS